MPDLTLNEFKKARTTDLRRCLQEESRRMSLPPAPIPSNPKKGCIGRFVNLLRPFRRIFPRLHLT